MKQYNGVPLDGRQMNIQMVTSDLNTIASRLTSPRAGNQQATQRRVPVGGNRGGQRVNSAGQRGGRGARRGGGQKQAAPTAEELDADLESYRSQLK